MADGAAANRAHNAVMTGIVAGDAAYNSAFQAALRLGRRNPERGRESQSGCDRCQFHDQHSFSIQIGQASIGQHSIAVHSDQGGDEHREGQAEENFAAYH
jgi:hypothetical protein